MNIYVGNVPHEATDDEIRTLFAAFGNVASVAMIKDKFTGQPRGFGFVEMPTLSEGQKAIQDLNGKEFKGRNLTVNPAKPREERTGGGGGGGYNDRRKPSGGSGRRSSW
jgi:cold-inducible RNA-binding protein